MESKQCTIVQQPQFNLVEGGRKLLPPPDPLKFKEYTLMYKNNNFTSQRILIKSQIFPEWHSPRSPLNNDLYRFPPLKIKTLNRTQTSYLCKIYVPESMGKLCGVCSCTASHVHYICMHNKSSSKVAST